MLTWNIDGLSTAYLTQRTLSVVDIIKRYIFAYYCNRLYIIHCTSYSVHHMHVYMLKSMWLCMLYRLHHKQDVVNVAQSYTLSKQHHPPEFCAVIPHRIGTCNFSLYPPTISAWYNVSLPINQYQLYGSSQTSSER